MTRLITRADDAGSCVSANLAIVEGLEAGVLRNVGVMAPGPAFDHAVELLRDRRDVCLGLHTTLNAEWDTVKWGPVSPVEMVPSLVEPDGNFTWAPAVLHQRGFAIEEALAEIRAQLAKCRGAGLEIRYLDEHMGVSWIGFRDELVALCEDEGIVYGGRLPYLDVPQEGDLGANLLASLKPGTWVYVTHPGMDAPDMQDFVHEGLERGQVARERDRDRRLWLDPRLRGAFESVRFDEA